MSRFSTPTATIGKAPSHAPPDVHYAPGYSTAQVLGWFSIGLGVAELLFPKQVSKISGNQSLGVLQLFGLREIVAGVGILTSEKPAKWVAARVAGDVLDLAALGTGISQTSGQDREAAIVSTLAVVGVTALDVMCYAGLQAGEALEG
jgi:hypothetical protein